MESLFKGRSCRQPNPSNRSDGHGPLPLIAHFAKHLARLGVDRIVLIALLLGPLALAEAAVYHVDAIAGNDSSSGDSPAAPWRSLEKVNATIFQAGDKLLLKAGASWMGRLHPKGSGSAGNPIVLDRYGEGAPPTIHGGGIAGGAVVLENQQYWSIRNLEITNCGSREAKKSGIQIRNTSVGTLSGIEVKNCSVHDVTGEMADYKDGKESGGIVFSITAADLTCPSKWDDIRIEDNTLRDVAREGILLQSQWINKPDDPNSSWRGHGAYTTSTRVHIADNRLEVVGGDGIIVWCVKGRDHRAQFRPPIESQHAEARPCRHLALFLRGCCLSAQRSVRDENEIRRHGLRFRQQQPTVHLPIQLQPRQRRRLPQYVLRRQRPREHRSLQHQPERRLSRG